MFGVSICCLLVVSFLFSSWLFAGCGLVVRWWCLVVMDCFLFALNFSFDCVLVVC